MIYDVRVTAAPAYELHRTCVTLGIPYVHLRSRYSGGGVNHRKISRTTFVPNRLVYVDSLELLEEHWAELVSSSNPWSVVVHASEEEASELMWPYAEVARSSWVLNGLMTCGQLVETITRVEQGNANATYLSSVITELYKVQPKEERPFLQVFRYLSGVTSRFDTDRPGLRKAVKAAYPIRKAIKSLGKDRTMPAIRLAAKAHGIDIFEINYTLARGTVAETDDDI